VERHLCRRREAERLVIQSSAPAHLDEEQDAIYSLARLVILTTEPQLTSQLYDARLMLALGFGVTFKGIV
jgi:hypothetical protein